MNPLESLARRVESAPFFLACALRDYANSEKLDDAALPARKYDIQSNRAAGRTYPAARLIARAASWGQSNSRRCVVMVNLRWVLDEPKRSVSSVPTEANRRSTAHPSITVRAGVMDFAFFVISTLPLMRPVCPDRSRSPSYWPRHRIQMATSRYRISHRTGLSFSSSTQRRRGTCQAAFPCRSCRRV